MRVVDFPVSRLDQTSEKLRCLPQRINYAGIIIIAAADSVISTVLMFLSEALWQFHFLFVLVCSEILCLSVMSNLHHCCFCIFCLI